MRLNYIAKEVHETCVEKGFWEDDQDQTIEKIALIGCEVSEAIEALRDTDQPYYRNQGSTKPEGWAVEIVDVIIRSLDLLYAHDVDIEWLLEMKHEYNKNRPHKHGRLF